MGRKKTPENQRKETLESLEESIKKEKLEAKFYKDQIELYMGFYDDLNLINDKVIILKNDKNFSLRSYTDATSEKRRIAKEMRDILTFLGLKPTEKGGGGGYQAL